MSNSIATSVTFEDKMRDRIRDGIGDLITDDELNKLIQRGIEETFFKKKTIKKGYDTIEGKSFIEEMLLESLQPRMRSSIDEWVKSNSDLVAKSVEAVITRGAGDAVVKAFNDMFQSQFYMFQSNIQNMLGQPR